MLTKMMNWSFIPMMLPVLWTLLWPLPAGYLILLASAVCVGAILGFQTGRAEKHFWETGYATVPCKVKYEN
jgi:hypothetical protein